MISKVLNTTKTSFSRLFGKADNRIVFAADLNSVIDQFNSSLGYDLLGFNTIVSVDDLHTPGLVGVGGGVTADKISCRAGTQPYQYTNGTWGCINHILVLRYANYFPVVTNNVTGVYVFTFPTAPPNGYDVILSPPSLLNGARISLVKTSSTVFTITTADVSGGAANLLAGMYLGIQIYN